MCIRDRSCRRPPRHIFAGIAALRAFPNRGRVGLVENTREIVFFPWPYIAVYQIIDDQAEVIRIRHAAQNWP